MITKQIVAFGKKQIIACDGKCDKAFGLNGRPFVRLSEDENDIAWLSDNEVGIAPASGKTNIVSEGGECKPNLFEPETKLNRWCYRECERCVSVNLNETIQLPNFNERICNMKKN